MKIQRLQIKAFGHFSDVAFDFASDTPGLHIIYGPNEGGKSTALRAIRGLLYGIPMRTADNFLHDYNKLLIGGCLANADGEELTVWRRKRKVGGLLGADMNAIEESQLAQFLHGIEEPLFNTLFGIDHETLVSGGRDILEQKGDVGQALFAAGAGLSSLHGIIEKLDKEAGDLFKSGGSKPALNQAIKAHQDCKREIRDISLSSSAWKEQQDALDKASAELEQIERQNRLVQSELQGLQRLQKALPHLAKRGDWLQQLADLADVAHLPPDFPTQTQDALAEHTKIAARLLDLQSRQTDLEQKKADCLVGQGIIEQAESINQQHQGLEAFRLAQRDRPKERENSTRLLNEAEALLNQVNPLLSLDQPDAIKSLLAKRHEIGSLAKQLAGIQAGLEQAGRQAGTAANGLNKVELELAALEETPDLSLLAAAVTSAQKAGDLDGSLGTMEVEALKLRQQAEADLQRLGLWHGDSKRLLTLPLPPLETVECFIDRYKDLADSERERQKQAQETQKELDRITSELKQMAMTGAVLTEHDLTQARAHREQGWQLIRRVWLQQEEAMGEIQGYGADKALPDAYAYSVLKADDVSDQLRVQAERVHQYARLVSDQQKGENRQARHEAELAELKRQRQQAEADWLAVWCDCGLQPRPPREMRTWLEQCQGIRRSLQEATQKVLALQPLIADRRRLCRALAEALQGLGKPSVSGDENLNAALNHAEAVWVALKALQDRRVTLENERRRLAQDLKTADNTLTDKQQAMEAWRKNWGDALCGFGLPRDATPNEAENALETLGECLKKKNESIGLEKRISDMDDYMQGFAQSAKALIQAIAPEWDALPPDQATLKLHALLGEANSARTLQQTLAADLASLLEDLRVARVEQGSIAQGLAKLRELANCDDDAALLQIAGRFQHYQDLKKALAQTGEMLTVIAEGVALADLERQWQQTDPNELQGRIDSLSRQSKDELEPRIKALSEKKGAARSELQRMDGSGKAAAKEEEAQAALAKVRRLAGRYLRVRLAALLLKQEIDQYRQAHQDPILGMASRYFAELTLNAFQGLRSDVNDSGQPILVGINPGDSRKTVEEMSAGTRDQLYLALRLATLEWRLQKHEPMPLIADDILVNFDDRRTEATLQALAALGRDNQVILFTHHRQILQSAQPLLQQGSAFIHAIAPS